MSDSANTTHHDAVTAAFDELFAMGLVEQARDADGRLQYRDGQPVWRSTEWGVTFSPEQAKRFFALPQDAIDGMLDELQHDLVENLCAALRGIPIGLAGRALGAAVAHHFVRAGTKSAEELERQIETISRRIQLEFGKCKRSDHDLP